jgi:nickel/cobalt exporter
MDISSFGVLGIYSAALLLGAAHSLEPGHGKTVVAAYLVASRGRNIDAVILGLVVTFTHSFSIIILGLIAKASSRYFTDQELHGYLGIVSSLIILGIGLWMIRSRWLGLRDPSRAHGHRHLFGGGHHHHGTNHDHGHSHDKDHTDSHSIDDGHIHNNDHDSSHGHDHGHDHGGERQLGLAGLILLGISGGIVPCPAALAILLASASVGDIGKGLALVLIFSLGLAIALVAIGLAVVNGVRATNRFIDTERYAPKVAFASAILVTIIGAATMYSSLTHFGVK